MYNSNINSITYEMLTTLSLYLYKTLASDCNFVALDLLELSRIEFTQ